uniref:Uncharacterized protein n=1 Tax=Acrobeloides nanus TaxID=290746 RepID=A0A914E593_9BILA
MMASLNSPAAENDHTQSQQLPNQEQDESTPKVPIILTKKKNGKKVTAINYTKYISTMTPPPGKDFALHSLVQTNLIDSKGRLLKGVKSVPIQVPASVETRNPKPRSFAKIVDDDADRIVPIKFTKAERKKYTE